MTPFFRGWSKADCHKLQDKGNFPPLLAQEAFQYGFEAAPLAAHDDTSVPIHKRLFRGPNTWPDARSVGSDFKDSVDYLTQKYHELTHKLGAHFVSTLQRYYTSVRSRCCATGLLRPPSPCPCRAPDLRVARRGYG